MKSKNKLFGIVFLAAAALVTTILVAKCKKNKNFYDDDEYDWLMW